MAEISLICKRTVVSTKPVQAGKFCSLSVLDRAMEHNHLHIVFYYHSPKYGKPGESIKLLRESISGMLCAFPIVTGRLLRTPEGHWMIKCNDAGMRMVEARAKGNVERWLQNLNREKELKLVHWEPMFHKPYYWSTFYVQLTEFEEGGLAIGLSCTHLLSDPICATMLIKAWADTTLNGSMISPPFFHPLPSRRMGSRNSNHRPDTELINHRPNTELINHYKSAMEKPDDPAMEVKVKYTTISLAFNDKMVRNCIAMANAPDSSDQPSPTPFEALAAVFWICISRIRGKKQGLIDMSICLDMRKVLGLDKGFFGNCMVFNGVNGDKIEENQFFEAISAIREVVKKMDSDGILDLIEWLEEKDYQSPPRLNGYDLICTNLELVDSYSAIFEDSFVPICASYYIEPALGKGNILILPSPPGKGPLGRVVAVTLPESEAIELLDDKLIKQFSPTILMKPDEIQAKANSNPEAESTF